MDALTKIQYVKVLWKTSCLVLNSMRKRLCKGERFLLLLVRYTTTLNADDNGLLVNGLQSRKCKVYWIALFVVSKKWSIRLDIKKTKRQLNHDKVMSVEYYLKIIITHAKFTF